MIHGYMLATPDHEDIAERLKATGCEKLHRETADSGKAKRQRRQRVVQALGAGDVLVVAGLSQFADSMLDLLNALRTIGERKAVFRSLAEPWANTGARGVKPLAFLEGVVAFERDLRSARTEMGQARALARGVKLGRKPKLTPKQRQEAHRRRLRGETLATIAEDYDVSHSTISRLVA